MPAWASPGWNDDRPMVQRKVTGACDGVCAFVWSPLGATKPCLEQVIGLHHATDPGLKPKFNQAIPLHLIAPILRAKNKLPSEEL
jgi:hypothetical protein